MGEGASGFTAARHCADRLCAAPKVLYESCCPRADNALGKATEMSIDRRSMLPFAAVVFLAAASVLAQDAPPSGFSAMFNGKALAGWRVPTGANGHWRVLDGVID